MEDEENKSKYGGYVPVRPTPPKPKLPKLPKFPKLPSVEQFREARRIKEWSIDRVAEESKNLGLPVDKNAIDKIEKGEDPGTPVKDMSNPYSGCGTDYRGESKFYQDMSYEQRLHLTYLLLGCIFRPNDDVTWVDPVDLWGAFAQLNSAWENPSADFNRVLNEHVHETEGQESGAINIFSHKVQEPDTIDIARKLIDSAFKRARGIPK